MEKADDLSTGARYDHEMGLVQTTQWVQEMGSERFEHFVLIALSTETGEVLDVYKKSMTGQKTFDREHCLEEMSDVLWSLSLLAQGEGSSMNELMEIGIAKMHKRHPERYAAPLAERS